MFTETDLAKRLCRRPPIHVSSEPLSHGRFTFTNRTVGDTVLTNRQSADTGVTSATLAKLIRDDRKGRPAAAAAMGLSRTICQDRISNSQTARIWSGRTLSASAGRQVTMMYHIIAERKRFDQRGAIPPRTQHPRTQQLYDAPPWHAQQLPSILASSSRNEGRTFCVSLPAARFWAPGGSACTDHRREEQDWTNFPAELPLTPLELEQLR